MRVAPRRELAEITPDEQRELEALVANLRVVASIGQAINVNKREARRLEQTLGELDQTGRKAPDGYVFAITSGTGKFEISEYHRAIGYGGEPGWHLPRAQEFGDRSRPRQIMFIATYIGHNPYLMESDEVGTVYADSPDGDVRCKINGDGYEVGLIPVDEIPATTVNSELLAVKI